MIQFIDCWDFVGPLHGQYYCIGHKRIEDWTTGYWKTGDWLQKYIKLNSAEDIRTDKI